MLIIVILGAVLIYALMHHCIEGSEVDGENFRIDKITEKLWTVRKVDDPELYDTVFYTKGKYRAGNRFATYQKKFDTLPEAVAHTKKVLKGIKP